MDIRRKLNAINNRAMQRRHSNYTPTEQRRHDALYARLNEIDGITDGAK